MSFSLVYLIERFFLRIRDFFYHWYVGGSLGIFRYFIDVLESFDRTLALKVTLLHFFEPLYGDYSIVGRVLGIIFRTFRVIIGFIIYLFLAVVAFVIYLVWLLIPILIIYEIIKNVR
jgi:hypothetical protein